MAERWVRKKMEPSRALALHMPHPGLIPGNPKNSRSDPCAQSRSKP